jgi:hypothetical protein
MIILLGPVQAVLKHMGEYGLKPKYADDAGFRMRVGKLRALASLPLDVVVDAFHELKSEFEEAEQPLLAYFESAWVGGPIRGATRAFRQRSRKLPMFALDLWNVHGRALQENMLTNNNAELFHRHFANMSPQSNPTLATCVEGLQSQMRITHLDIAEVGMGEDRKEKQETKRRTSCIKNILEAFFRTRAVSGSCRASDDCITSIAQLYRTDSGW